MKLKQSDSIYPFPLLIGKFFCPRGLSPYQCIVAKYSGECLAKLIRFQSCIQSSSIIYDYTLIGAVYGSLLTMFGLCSFGISYYEVKLSSLGSLDASP